MRKRPLDRVMECVRPGMHRERPFPQENAARFKDGNLSRATDHGHVVARGSELGCEQATDCTDAYHQYAVRRHLGHTADPSPAKQPFSIPHKACRAGLPT